MNVNIQSAVLIAGFLVQETPNPSLLTSDMTSRDVSPLLALQTNALNGTGVQLEATTTQQQKARLWGRRGGRSFIPKDPKSVEPRVWNGSVLRPRFTQASETALGQEQPDTVTGMEPHEGGGGLAVFGTKQIDNTLRGKSRVAKEGEGELGDTNISNASQSAIKDESKQEMSSIGHH